MFVKVVFPISQGGSGQVQLYECDRVFYRKHIEVFTNPDTEKYRLVLEMEKDGKSLDNGIGLWFGDEEVHIYLMNDSGKTIDTIMWQNGEYK